MCYRFGVGHFEAIRMAPNVHTPGKAVALQPTALVLGGPYRFTRNQDYIGQTLLCAGIGLMLDAPAVLVATVPALLAVHYAVVPREERFLAQQLGAPYLEYLRRLRRRL